MPHPRPVVVPIEAPRPVEAGYLSLRSLSKYSDMSVRTLRKLLTDPTHPLPHLRLPGKVLVKRADFDAWMEHFRIENEDTVSPVVESIVEGLRHGR